MSNKQVVGLAFVGATWLYVAGSYARQWLEGRRTRTGAQAKDKP